MPTVTLPKTGLPWNVPDNYTTEDVNNFEAANLPTFQMAARVRSNVQKLYRTSQFSQADLQGRQLLVTGAIKSALPGFSPEKIHAISGVANNFLTQDYQSGHQPLSNLIQRAAQPSINEDGNLIPGVPIHQGQTLQGNTGLVQDTSPQGVAATQNANRALLQDAINAQVAANNQANAQEEKQHPGLLARAGRFINRNASDTVSGVLPTGSDVTQGVANQLNAPGVTPQQRQVGLNPDFWENLAPGENEAVNNAYSGAPAAIVKFGRGLMTPDQISLLAATGGVGKLAQGFRGIDALWAARAAQGLGVAQKGATGYFGLQGIKGTLDAAGDTKLQASDPQQYAANILLNAGMTGLAYHGLRSEFAAPDPVADYHAARLSGLPIDGFLTADGPHINSNPLDTEYARQSASLPGAPRFVGGLPGAGFADTNPTLAPPEQIEAASVRGLLPPAPPQFSEPAARIIGNQHVPPEPETGPAAQSARTMLGGQIAGTLQSAAEHQRESGQPDNQVVDAIRQANAPQPPPGPRPFDTEPVVFGYQDSAQRGQAQRQPVAPDQPAPHWLDTEIRQETPSNERQPAQPQPLPQRADQSARTNLDGGNRPQVQPDLDSANAPGNPAASAAPRPEVNAADGQKLGFVNDALNTLDDAFASPKAGRTKASLDTIRGAFSALRRNAADLGVPVPEDLGQKFTPQQAYEGVESMRQALKQKFGDHSQYDVQPTTAEQADPFGEHFNPDAYVQHNAPAAHAAPQESPAAAPERPAEPLPPQNAAVDTPAPHRDAAAAEQQRDIRRAQMDARTEPTRAEKAPAYEPPASEDRTANHLAGNKGTAYTADNTPVPFHYAAVPLDDLVASHHDHGTHLTENEGYNQNLQPRDRTRVASLAQIDEIHRKMTPGRLMAAPETNQGAPIIGKDNMVESGNGRTLALKRVFAENGVAAQKYRGDLLTQARDFGLDAADIAKMQRDGKNPVLVRVNDSDLPHDSAERASLAAEMGKDAGAKMSEVETAQNDAKNLVSSGALRHFQPNGTGDVTTRANLPFVRAFMDTIPASEQAGLMNDRGELAHLGERRLTNAMIAAAYDDPGAIAKLTEGDMEETGRRVGRALVAAAPKIALMKEEIARGDLYDLDPGRDLTDAANRFANIRKNGQSVAEYLAHGGGLFDDLSDTGREWLRLFGKYAEGKRGSITKMSALLNNYADVARDAGNPKQQTAFDVPGARTPHPIDALAAAEELTDNAGNTAFDFGSSPEPQNRSNSAATAQPGEETPGQTRPNPHAPGEIELNSGITPKNVADALVNLLGGPEHLARVTDAIKSFVTGDKPVLRRLSPAAHNAVTQHESSASWAALEANKVLPGVMKPLEDAGGDLAPRFLAYGIADRMIAERTRLTGEISKAQTALTATESASKAARQALTDAKRDLVKNERTFNDLPRDQQTAQRSAYQKTRNAAFAEIRKQQDRIEALGQAKKKQGATLSDMQDQHANIALGRAQNPFLDPVDGHAITPANVADYFKKAPVQEALKRYQDDVIPLLERNQKQAGGTIDGTKGVNSKVYFPALALDANGEPLGGPTLGADSGGRNAPLAQIGVNQRAKTFQGTAANYRTDFHETLGDVLRDGLDKATERAMHQTLLGEGITQPTHLREIDPVSGKEVVKPNAAYVRGHKPTAEAPHALEMKNPDGQWEPAVDFTLQRARGFKQLGSVDPNLPPKVVAPTRVYNELRPLLDRAYRDPLEHWANNHFARFMETYLGNTADMIQHSAALASRAAHSVGRLDADKPLTQQRNLFAAGRSVVNFVKYFNPEEFTPDQRYEAMKFGARAGVLPKNYPVTAPEGAGPIRRAINLGKAKLYGEGGILENAITSVYHEFKNAGALNSDQGRTMLRDALRDFNTHGATDQATLGKALRGMGLGTFYQTGVKNRLTGLRAGTKAYAAGLAGSVLLKYAMAKYFDPQHRDPWDVPGQKWGDVRIGTINGQPHYLNLNVIDRVANYGEYPFASLLHSKQTRANAGHTALNFGVDTANWLSPPIASGPLVNIASAVSGVTPHVQLNHNLTGIELTGNRAKGLPYTSWQRLAAIGQAALPTTTIPGDVADIDSKYGVHDPKTRAANFLLRLGGLPTIHTGQPEAAVLKATRQQERAEQHAQRRL